MIMKPHTPQHNPDMEGLSRYLEEVDRIVEVGNHELIPVLQRTQDLLGFLPKNALLYISDKIDVSMTQIYGVTTYFNRFRLAPVGKYVVKVCCGTTCHLAGAEKLTQGISNELAIVDGQTTPDEMFTLDAVPCVGCCSLAPVILVNDEAHARVTLRDTLRTLKDCREEDHLGVVGGAAEVKRPSQNGSGEAQITIKVGMGACGISAGAKQVYLAIEREIAARDNLPSLALAVTGCEGACFQEVLVYVQTALGGTVAYKRVTPEMVPEIFDRHIERSQVIRDWMFDSAFGEANADGGFYEKQERLILHNCGKIDPDSIDDYIGERGYEAFTRAVLHLERKKIISDVLASGLRGRGGAGFPTGVKWKAVSETQDPVKYIICNADEGDPGAFMDRNVIESDPHSVIEGLLIAAYAIGATEGFFYIREEYPLAVKRLQNALEQARERGFLGDDILGSGFSFDIEIKEGAGAFVCGEETALIRSIEGERGIPVQRPPYPTTSGLWGKPTLINNVETLANVTWIILNGVDSYTNYGTRNSKGTKIFTLAGNVERGGMIEVPMGTTLREIVYDIGGGNGDRTIKAVHIGGPSGGCLPESLFDTPIDFDQLQKWGTIMGSGGMLVMDDGTCMVDIAKYFLRFTQAESCGKCTFCRIGTKRMYEILDRITKGDGRAQDLDDLEELATQLGDSSLCGLGKSASNPVLTTLRYFRSEYEEHIFNKTCPAMSCRDLLSYKINLLQCEGCTVCSHYCQADAITRQDDQIALLINPSRCNHCGGCHEVCHFDAVTIFPLEQDVASPNHN